MPLFLVAITVAAIVIAMSVRAAHKGSLGWLKSRGIDCVVFLATFTSFVFSIGITGRIAIYVSEYNASVATIMGSLTMNLALFFVPGLLFIASLISAVRLLQRTPKE